MKIELIEDRFEREVKECKNCKPHLFCLQHCREWDRLLKMKCKPINTTREGFTMTEARIAGERIEPGNMFVTSWGYDQTNYDFIVVLSISKTGKTAKCQRTAAKNMGASGTCDLLKPVYEPFGDVFTMQLRTGYKGDLNLRGSYPFCCNGSMDNTRLDTFSRVDRERTYEETNPMFGH